MTVNAPVTVSFWRQHRLAVMICLTLAQAVMMTASLTYAATASAPCEAINRA